MFCVVPGAILFCVCEPKFFMIVLVGYFVGPPGYFVRLILVLFCGALYGVLCMCCVCFVPPQSYVVSPCAVLHVCYMLQSCSGAKHHAKM